MKGQAVSAAVPLEPELSGLEPIERMRKRWPMVLGGLLTAAMVGALLYELMNTGFANALKVVPVHPLFWIAFAAFYLGPPTFDYIIFKRLWNIPLDGMWALHRKRVLNDTLVGYSGEAYFYAWARQRTEMVSAPFGAVKDVMILSAMAGNAVTLAMLVLTLPFATELLTPTQLNWAVWSLVIIVGMSLPFLVFSKRVFSLDRKTLWWVFMIHCLRLVSGLVFVAVAWHFVMPEVSVGIWVLLSAARLLVTRLPVVPNKDLLFATFAIMVIGRGEALSELIAFTGALTLLVHVLLIAGMAANAVLRKR